MNRHAALSQREFDALLGWLAPGRDQAGEKYELARRMLTRYFEWRHCVPPDEYVDETFDRVARRLAMGEQIRSADPCTYFRGVARNVCLECQKHNAHQIRNLPSITTTLCDRPSPLAACLEHCLNTLAPEGRELLESYYLSRRRELPARLGITPNAVRLRVFKEKQKLRTCVARRLQLSMELPDAKEFSEPAPVISISYSPHRK